MTPEREAEIRHIVSRAIAQGLEGAVNMSVDLLAEIDRLRTSLPASPPLAPVESEGVMTRKQAHALAMDILDGEEAEDVHVSVRDGHEGRGWYASIAEHDEEGCVFLGAAPTQEETEQKAARTLLAMEREMHTITKRELADAETAIGWAIRRIAEEGLDVTPKHAHHKPLHAAVYAVVDHHAEHHRKLTALRAELAPSCPAPSPAEGSERERRVTRAAEALLDAGAGFMPEPLPDGSRPWPWHALPEMHALRSALALPAGPPESDAVYREVAEAVRDALWAEVSTAEERMRKCNRRGVAAELQIIGKFCAMHLDIPGLVARVLARRGR